MIPLTDFRMSLNYCNVVVLFFLCVSTVSADEKREGTKITINEILQEWKKRQIHIRTVSFEWIQERTYTQYWANCHVPDARHEYLTLRFKPSRLILNKDKLRFDAGAVDSSGDVIEFDGSRQIDELGRVQHDDARRIFRDDRIRYDRGRKRVDPRSPSEPDWPRNLRTFSLIFDGTQNLQFLPTERGSYPEGYIFQESLNRFKDSLYFRPLVLTFRPFWLNPDAKQFSISEKKENINGHQCLVLIDHSGLGRKFWVDPDREYLVCRYQENCNILGARMQTQIEITYSISKSKEWLPSAWKTIFLDNHGLLEQYCLASITKSETNSSIAEDLFKLDFPAETWVYDENSREHWISHKNGHPRIVTSDELNRGATYHQLVTTKSNQANLKQSLNRLLDSIWIKFLSVALLLLLGTYWIWRRKKVLSELNA